MKNKLIYDESPIKRKDGIAEWKDLRNEKHIVIYAEYNVYNEITLYI